MFAGAEVAGECESPCLGRLWGKYGVRKVGEPEFVRWKGVFEGVCDGDHRKQLNSPTQGLIHDEQLAYSQWTRIITFVVLQIYCNLSHPLGVSNALL